MLGSKTTLFHSRRGVVIFVAFSLIGVIGVFAAIYMFTSSQSRSQSRRIFFGEAGFLLAESLLDETFHQIKVRARDPNEAKIGGGSWFLNTLTDAAGTRLAMDRDVGEYLPFTQDFEFVTQMGVKPGDVEILVLPLLFSDADSRLKPDEKHGVLEVVVTVKVPLATGGTSSAGVTRQVVGRREFRIVRILGSDAVQQYSLYIKKSPAPAAISSSDSFTRLSIMQPMQDGQSYHFGRVWLGSDKLSVLQPSMTTGREATYLSSTGIFGERSDSGYFENEFRSAAFFEDVSEANSDKLEFVLNNLLQDPNLKEELKKQDSNVSFEFTSMTEDEKKLAREAVRLWVIDNFRRYPSSRIAIRSYPQRISYPSLSLALDGASGFSVEGKVLRLFGFEGENRYNGKFMGGEDDDSSESSYPFYDLRVANQVYGRGERAWLPVFHNQPDGLAGKDERAMAHLAYTIASNFAYVYGISERGAFQDFLGSHALLTGSGELYLKLDGIAVVYDHLEFKQPVVYEGCGVILAVGSISIEKSIRRLTPGSASCLQLVARALPVGESRMPVAVQILTEEPIEAHISAFGFEGSAREHSLRSGSAFDLSGGLGLDVLNLRDVAAGSRIQYDPIFSKKYMGLSVGIPFRYFKIHNQAKEKRS